MPRSPEAIGALQRRCGSGSNRPRHRQCALADGRVEPVDLAELQKPVGSTGGRPPLSVVHNSIKHDMQYEHGREAPGTWAGITQ